MFKNEALMQAGFPHSRVAACRTVFLDRNLHTPGENQWVQKLFSCLILGSWAVVPWIDVCSILLPWRRWPTWAFLEPQFYPLYKEDKMPVWFFPPVGWLVVCNVDMQFHISPFQCLLQNVLRTKCLLIIDLVHSLTFAWTPLVSYPTLTVLRLFTFNPLVLMFVCFVK